MTDDTILPFSFPAVHCGNEKGRIVSSVMAGVAFAVEGDGVGFATESYAASALYTTLASLSGALWRIRRARMVDTPRQIRGDPCNVRTARLIFPKAASSAWSAVRLFSDAVRRAATRTRRVPNSAWNAVINCRQLALMQQAGQPRILPPCNLRRLQDRLNAASSRSCFVTLWVRPVSYIHLTLPTKRIV